MLLSFESMTFLITVLTCLHLRQVSGTSDGSPQPFTINSTAVCVKCINGSIHWWSLETVASASMWQSEMLTDKFNGNSKVFHHTHTYFKWWILFHLLWWFHVYNQHLDLFCSCVSYTIFPCPHSSKCHPHRQLLFYKKKFYGLWMCSPVERERNCCIVSNVQGTHQ